MSFTWSRKKILITGINGFVGGHIAKSLIELGAEVFGLIRTSKYNTFLYYENLDKNISLIHGDICDFNLLNRVISEEGINIIFHIKQSICKI